MIVLTLKVNGLMAAAQRGLFQWMKQQEADVICLQDIRTREADLPDEYVEVEGFHSFFFEAEIGHHAGTAIYSRTMPKAVIRGVGSPTIDVHGGFLQVDFNNVSVASVWVPYAQYVEDVDPKIEYLDALQHHFKRTRRKRRDFIFAGCYEMAHRSVDLGHWEMHQRSPGFLPEERAWMDEVLGPIGFVDAFRLMNKSDRQHTYWSFDEAQANGARFDYQLITPNLADYVTHAYIIREPRISTHCPVSVEYDLDL